MYEIEGPALGHGDDDPYVVCMSLCLLTYGTLIPLNQNCIYLFACYSINYIFCCFFFTYPIPSFKLYSQKISSDVQNIKLSIKSIDNCFVCISACHRWIQMDNTKVDTQLWLICFRVYSTTTTKWLTLS